MADLPEGLRDEDRFANLRRIGSGGMGVVYRAVDTERGEEVAVKVLRRTSPAALYRLKQEFRALVDIQHRNLASLYELVSRGDDWFFTMELVEGVDFRTYVRPTDARLNESRLREGFRQLVLGLAALHDAGKVHRDIKPSNIRVTETGRVVLMDFGLVSELGTSNESDLSIAGTPQYMAPEQITSGRGGAAADLYAVGVLLYEALAGRAPFLGTSTEVLAEKPRASPPSPRTLVPTVPRDLDALCSAMLSTDPGDRPTGREVLARLTEDDAPLLPLVSVAGSQGAGAREQQEATGKGDEAASLPAEPGDPQVGASGADMAPENMEDPPEALDGSDVESGLQSIRRERRLLSDKRAAHRVVMARRDALVAAYVLVTLVVSVVAGVSLLIGYPATSGSWWGWSVGALAVVVATLVLPGRALAGRLAAYLQARRGEA